MIRTKLYITVPSLKFSGKCVYSIVPYYQVFSHAYVTTKRYIEKITKQKFVIIIFTLTVRWSGPLIWGPFSWAHKQEPHSGIFTLFRFSKKSLFELRKLQKLCERTNSGRSTARGAKVGGKKLQLQTCCRCNQQICCLRCCNESLPQQPAPANVKDQIDIIVDDDDDCNQWIGLFPTTLLVVTNLHGCYVDGARPHSGFFSGSLSPPRTFSNLVPDSEGATFSCSWFASDEDLLSSLHLVFIKMLNFDISAGLKWSPWSTPPYRVST